MTDEHRMEGLSRAYVQAVAAVSGCTCARPEPDYGCDLTLRQIVKIGSEFRPTGRGLDIQLKSTTGATLTTTDVVYDLDVRAYNLLRRATHDAPLYLVLFVLPASPDEWLSQTEQRFELRHCAYWLSLRRRPAVRNTKTIRIHIPRQNQFTPIALARIMEAIRRQEDV